MGKKKTNDNKHADMIARQEKKTIREEKRERRDNKDKGVQQTKLK